MILAFYVGNVLNSSSLCDIFMTGGVDIIKCHVTMSPVIKYFLFAVDMNGINHTKMCRIVEQSYRSLLSVEVILPANVSLMDVTGSW